MKWFKHYKIAHVILLGWLVGSSVLRAQTNQFTPVEPTGLPYHVIIRNFNMTPTVSASVEIGLFTDTLCVGRIVTNSQNSNIDIVTWEGNPGYDLEGFTVGDTISVQVATEIFDTLQVMDGLVIPVVGNGTFGDGTYSVIDVSVNLLEFPAIALPPEYENLSFGNVYVGESVSDTIRVENNGSATLNAWFNSIPSGFSVEPQGFNLTPGSAQEIVITFAPWWARDYDENLYLQSNDPAQSVVTIHLRGTGARSPQSNLSVEFDPQALRRIPADRPVETTLLLTNTGDDSLTITGLESTHWIYTLPDTQFHLPPGGRYSTTVTAASAEPGNYSGYIRIYHDSGSQGNPISFWLNSTVYQRHFIPVEPTGLPYSIVIKRARVDGHLLPNPSDIGVFAGDLCVGEFYNDGESVNLQIVAWEADSELGLPGFTTGDSIEFRIYTSAYDSVITLIPDVTWLTGDGTFGAGAFSAVELEGRSYLEPIANVSTTTLMYGLVPIQAGDTLSFTIQNDGATPLNLWNWNNANAAFTPLVTPASIPAGDSVEIPVWFHPASAAWETGSLTFSTNDPNLPYQNIHFSGGGTVDGTAALRVDVPEIRFGDVPVGDTTVVALYLRNAGNADLVVTAIHFDSPDIWVSEDSLVIPPGNATSVDVYWRPGSVGHFWSQVFISSNSSDNVNASLSITGFGFDAYFEPVTPTGQSYQIIVSSLIDSAGLGFREGDEIGVFHENVCVGRGVYHPGSVNITAWQRDTQHGLPGFVAGDIMLFKYHSLTPDSNFTTVALDAVPTIIQGDGTFGSGPFAEIALTILGESNPLQPYDGPVYWVSQTRGTDYLNNGQFSQPFRTIQHALNNTISGDTILVEPGTYTEKLAFKGHDVVLQSVAGADSTIITKPGDGPLVSITQSESPAAVISGFTITGGTINGNGAGIFIHDASPTLTDLVIENNQSLMGDGGGVYLFNSQTVIENCVVRNNSAMGNGGGIAVTNASIVSVRHTIVSNNIAEWGGGVFVGPDVDADFDHFLFTENEAILGGGFYNTGSLILTFATIANNTSTSYSGGLTEGAITLSHSILYGNQEAEVEFGFFEGVSPNITYSLVNLPEPGETNLNSDPLFADLAGGDYHLNRASPAIDAGNPALDFHLEPEPNGDRVNLGYYGATAEATVAELRTPLPAQLDAVEDSLFSLVLQFPPDSNVVFQADYIDGPGWLAFSTENLLLFGTPENQHVGMAPVTIHSWDNFGRRDTVTVPLTVINTNDPPIIQSLPDTQLTQDIAWSYTVDVNDPDLDDSLRVVVDEMPPGMVFDSTLVQFDWTPVNEDVGQHIFAFSITDDSGAVAIQTDTLTVENMNDPPELVEAPEPLTLPEGAADTLFVLSPLFRDVDQLVVYDSLSYQVSGFDSTLLAVSLAHDSLRIQPLQYAYGETEIVITVTDLAGAGVEAVLAVSIDPVNDPPQPFHLLNPDSITFEEYSDSILFRWNASFDPDPTDTLLYQLLIHDSPDFTDVPAMAMTPDTTILIASADLQQDVIYFWKVMTSDPSGEIAGSIETHEFVLNFANSPPEAPLAIEPANGAILTSSPYMMWEMVSDPDVGDTIYFEAVLSLQSDFADTLATYFGSDTTWNLTDTVALSENDQHFWQVRAVDVGGLASGWTGPYSFFYDAVNEAPSIPETIAPMEEAVFETRPILTWQPSMDADPSDPDETLRYRIRLWDALDTLDYVTISSDTSFLLPDSLEEDNYYHWQVAAMDPAGLLSNWSPPVSFGVNAQNEPPEIFQLLVPLPSDTVYQSPVLLVWGSAQESEPFDSVNYQLEIDFSLAFDAPEITTTGDTSLADVMEWQEDTWHYWRVRAIDTQDAEQISDIDSFYVNLIPNRLPVAEWLIADSVVTGTVPLAFTASDPDSQSVTVSVAYKTAAMSDFASATADPSTTHDQQFGWNSQADLPDFYGEVQLEIIPFDGEETGQGDTTLVVVDNMPPAVNLTPISGAFYDSVAISYIIDNDAISPITLRIDYRLSGAAAWGEIDPGHFSETPGTVAGETYNLIWYSHHDLPDALGDSVSLRIIAQDYSATDTVLSTPFVVINNYAPTVAFGELFQWNHDTIPVPVHYNDADDDQIELALQFSTDGITFQPATLVNGPAETITTVNPLSRLTNQSARREKSFDVPKNFLPQEKQTSATIRTAGDTILYWDSRADLPDQYMWFAWLAVRGEDAGGAAAFDTVNTLVDNFRPELSITLPDGELSDNITLTGEIRNDSLHAMTLTGQFLLAEGDAWQHATLDYEIQPGDTTFSAVWRSGNDLPFGFDGVLDLRFFAYDSVQSSDTTTFGQVHVDNNQPPEILNIGLPEGLIRGDVVFTLTLDEPENDSLNFTFRYSLNNGVHYAASTDFTILRDTLDVERYYLVWHSFENVVNYYDSDVRVAIRARDNDAGAERVSEAFLLNNRGGPRLARVVNPGFPTFLWTDTLKLAFTAPLLPQSIPGTLALTRQAEPVPFTWWLSADSVRLFINPDSMLQPFDTLQMTLYPGITGANGLAFDGNYNYLPDGEADSLMISFQTPMPADYSGNNSMDMNDLTAFVSNWNLSEPSLSYEIGPAVGEVPYETFIPDGQFDFEDLMVFIAMWKWDHNRAQQLAKPLVEEELPRVALPEEFEIRTSGIITADGQPVATIALETNSSASLPAILRWEITGLDSHNTRSTANWRGRFENTAQLNDGAGDLFLGLTPGDDPVILPGNLIVTMAEIDRPREIEVQIGLWDLAGDLMARDIKNIWIDPQDFVPQTYFIQQNYPNPFNGNTRIRWGLPEDAHTRMDVYNLKGERVRTLVNQTLPAGQYVQDWDGKNAVGQPVATGLYFIHLQTPGFSKTIKAVYLK